MTARDAKRLETEPKCKNQHKNSSRLIFSWFQWITTIPFRNYCDNKKEEQLAFMDYIPCHCIFQTKNDLT